MEKTVKYHCPVKDCLFSEANGRHFKRKMLIDQHFLNCHGERKFKCCNCDKRYAIDWQLKHHLKTCGLIWKCLTCEKSYKERLSLIAHCKRHCHLLPEEARRRKSKINGDDSNKVGPLNVIIFPIIMSPMLNGNNNNIITGETNGSGLLKCNSQHSLQQTPNGIGTLSKIKLNSSPQTNHIPILPKSDLNCNIKVANNLSNKSLSQASFVDTSVQTESLKGQRRQFQGMPTRTKKAQRATQTEKITKIRASRSAQCPPVTIKNQVNQCKLESSLTNTHTQTLESILLGSSNESPVTSSKSTWTSTLSPNPSLATTPPSTSQQIIDSPFNSKGTLVDPLSSSGLPSCSSSSSSRICVAIEDSSFNDVDYLIMDNGNEPHSSLPPPSYSLLTKSSNPLLSQLEDSNCSESSILFKEIGTLTCDDNFLSEQSVQTDETADFMFSVFNDIETQTTSDLLGDNIDLINLASVSNHESNENLFLSNLKLNDTETQTIWSRSQTTQTDSKHSKTA